jgi:hypothetical protein
MKWIVGLLFVTVFFVAACPAQIQPQDTPAASSPQLHRWDAAHGILFVRKNFVVKKTTVPPPRLQRRWDTIRI